MISELIIMDNRLVLNVKNLTVHVWWAKGGQGLA